MSAYVSAALRRSVRDRSGDRCAYCRMAEALTGTQFEIEHIVPRAAGGRSVFENLCLACPMCNRFKSDRTSALDSVIGDALPLFDPQRQRWDEHFAWSGDGAQVVGLTASGRATVAALRMNRPAVVRVRQMWVGIGVHPPTLD